MLVGASLAGLCSVERPGLVFWRDRIWAPRGSLGACTTPQLKAGGALVKFLVFAEGECGAPTVKALLGGGIFQAKS